jgi:hypothetical protein
MIDACMEKYGVDVPKAMSYREKNITVEAVLGDHRKQYPREIMHRLSWILTPGAEL